MEDSILDTLKKMLGLDKEFTSYDVDIITNINSIFMTLHQLGVGPTEVFSITGSDEVWSSFLANARTTNDLNAVKSYMYLRLRLLFDPPSSSYVLNSMDSQIKEYEWRLQVQAERSEEV